MGKFYHVKQVCLLSASSFWKVLLMLVLKLKQGHPKAAMFKPWPEEIPQA